ncbi:MAG: phosphate/phosphite/phosphonate ABC transporter substrate-binding protein [Persicimonas sp.]
MRRAVSVLFALLLVGAVGCDRKEEGDAAENLEEAQQQADEEKEEADKDEEPAVDELIYAFQPQENPESIAPDADKLAEYLAEETGIDSEVYLPTNYAGVVEALRGGKADVAYFSGWPYLQAHEKAEAELLVVEERDGEPFYMSRWYVKKDSDIEDLEDLEGEPIAFTSPTSTSGYLFPLAKVIQEGHLEEEGDPKDFFGEVIYAGGYEQSLNALVEGKVKAAAASDYAFERFLDEEEREEIEVLTEQGPVPTHGVAIRGDLPDEVKEDVKEALLSLNDEEHAELLESLYGAEKFVEGDHDEHVGALEEALEAVGAERDVEEMEDD